MHTIAASKEDIIMKPKLRCHACYTCSFPIPGPMAGTVVYFQNRVREEPQAVWLCKACFEAIIKVWLRKARSTLQQVFNAYLRQGKLGRCKNHLDGISV